MKKIILYVLTLASLLFLNACGQEKTNVKENSSKTENEKQIKIVTSIFPSYDWIKEISKGTDINVSYLTDSGVSLHNYEPSPEDIKKIISSDFFVYLGSHSDKWAEKIVEENPNLKAIKLIDIVEENLLEEEIKEGMEDHDHDDDDHDHDDHDHDEHDHSHHHHHEDEHIWLSIKNAKIICRVLAEKLSNIDNKNKDLYEKNLSNYLIKLDELDNEYKNELAKAKNKTLVFADRFPFRYLTEDYNLDYYAAFTGCSADAEASFDTLVFLVEKIKELDLKYVFNLTDSDGKIAKTVIENSKKDLKILKVNSMESINKAESEKTSYIDIMKENLNSIKEGLN